MLDVTWPTIRRPPRTPTLSILLSLLVTTSMVVAGIGTMAGVASAGDLSVSWWSPPPDRVEEGGTISVTARVVAGESSQVCLREDTGFLSSEPLDCTHVSSGTWFLDFSYDSSLGRGDSIDVFVRATHSHLFGSHKETTSTETVRGPDPDTTAPTINSWSTTVNDRQITVEAHVTDDDRGVDQVEVTYDKGLSHFGTTVQMASIGSNQYRVTIPVGDKFNWGNSIEVKVSAADNAGNSRTTPIRNVDIPQNHPPTISGFSVSPNSDRTITVEASVTDSTNRVDRVEVIWDTGLGDFFGTTRTMSHVGGSTYRLTIPTSGRFDWGENVQVKVRAHDDTGETTTSTMRTVQVPTDDTAPSIDWSVSPNGDRTVTISATVTDGGSGVDSVEAIWDTGLTDFFGTTVPMVHQGGNGYELTIPLSGRFDWDEDIQVKVRARDQAGNQRTTSIRDVSVAANKPPSVTGFSATQNEDRTITVEASVSDNTNRIDRVEVIWDTGLGDFLGTTQTMSHVGGSTYRLTIPTSGRYDWGEDVQVKVRAHDDTGKSTTTDIMVVQLPTDDSPPRIDWSATSNEDRTVTVEATVTDAGSGVSDVEVIWDTGLSDFTGTTEPMLNVGGDQYRIDIPLDGQFDWSERLQVKVRATDAAGNTFTTDIQTLSVRDRSEATLQVTYPATIEDGTVTIEGQLVDAETGAGLGGEPVSLMAEGTFSDDELATATTADDGQFVLQWTPETTDEAAHVETFVRFENADSEYATTRFPDGETYPIQTGPELRAFDFQIQPVWSAQVVTQGESTRLYLVPFSPDFETDPPGDMPDVHLSINGLPAAAYDIDPDGGQLLTTFPLTIQRATGYASEVVINTSELSPGTHMFTVSGTTPSGEFDRTIELSVEVVDTTPSGARGIAFDSLKRTTTPRWWIDSAIVSILEETGIEDPVSYTFEKTVSMLESPEHGIGALKVLAETYVNRVIPLLSALDDIQTGNLLAESADKSGTDISALHARFDAIESHLNDGDDEAAATEIDAALDEVRTWRQTLEGMETDNPDAKDAAVTQLESIETYLEAERKQLGAGGTLQLEFVDEDGTPVTADFTIRDANHTVVSEGTAATTDQDLTAGNYTVTASAAGHHSTFERVTVGVDEHLPVTVTLPSDAFNASIEEAAIVDSSTVYEPGDTVTVEAVITNTGEREHEYFVGFSVRGPDNVWRDNDGTTGRPETLAPGETSTVTLEWTVEPDAPAGEYDFGVAVWWESDREALKTNIDQLEHTDAFGVAGDATGEVSIEVGRSTASNGSSVALRVANPDDGTSYRWQVADQPAGTSASVVFDHGPQTSFRGVGEGSYTVQVTATHADGTVSVGQTTVVVTEQTVAPFDEPVMDIASQYAPLLQFHQQERYYPTRFEALVESSRLRERRIGIDRYVSLNPSVFDLAGEDTAGYYLDPLAVNADPTNHDALTEIQERYPETVYVSVHENVSYRGESYTAIGYWLVYINDPKPSDASDLSKRTAHSGDQEPVFILFDETGPRWVAAQQHKGGEVRRWDAVPTHNGRPILNPADGAHSNFFAPYAGADGSLIGVDVTQDNAFVQLYQDQYFNAQSSYAGPHRLTHRAHQFVPGRYVDSFGGGDVWGHESAEPSSGYPVFDERYELVHLTGEEVWADYEGDVYRYAKTSDFDLPYLNRIPKSDGDVPPQQARWNETGRWMTDHVATDHEQLRASITSPRSTNPTITRETDSWYAELTLANDGPQADQFALTVRATHESGTTRTFEHNVPLATGRVVANEDPRIDAPAPYSSPDGDFIIEPREKVVSVPLFADTAVPSGLWDFEIVLANYATDIRDGNDLQDTLTFSHRIETGVNAEVSIVEPPTGDVQVGDPVSATVAVENTGEQEHEFFVGYSAVGPNGEFFDNNGTTGRPVTIAPGEVRTVELEWTVEDEVPEGEYDLLSIVWFESDRDSLTTRLDDDRVNGSITVNGTSVGVLNIGSEPTDATVSIDGDQLDDRTPVTVELEAGTYDLQVEKSGYETVTIPVTVSPGERNEEFVQLDPLVSEFTVTIDDADAQVTAGSTVQLQATVQNVGSIEDSQTVAYQFDGETLLTEEVTLAPGEATTVQYSVELPDDIEPGAYQHGVASHDDEASTGVEVTEDSDTAVVISDFTVTNPDGNAIVVRFDASVALAEIEVGITDESGDHVATLTTSDFDGSGSTPTTYVAEADLPEPGTYTVTLLRASDANGRDGAAGQSATVTIEAPPPERGADIAPFEDTVPLAGDQITPDSLAEKITVERSVASNASAAVLRATSTNYSIALSADDGAENVTFYLQSEAISAAQAIEDLTMYLDGDEHPFVVNQSAGPGTSPWVAFNVPAFSTRTVSFIAESPDTTPPTISVDHPANGTRFPAGTDTTAVNVSYADAGTGVNTSTVELYHNGTEITPNATVTADHASVTLSGLTNGSTHTLTVVVTDAAGNRNSTTTTFHVAAARLLTAERSIHGRAAPGGNVTVSVEVQTFDAVDGPAVDEEIPSALTIVEHTTDPQATSKPSEQQWLWLQAPADSTLTLEYTLQVPETATSGDTFELDGFVSSANQDPVTIGGDRTLKVRTCIETAVAGSDGVIGLQDIQQAINWWATDTPVPDTGGQTMGLQRIQSLINAWATDTPVGCE